MSIFTRQSVRMGPVQGGDPIRGEPSGWYAEVNSVLGDASGGVMTVNFDYAAPFSPMSGRMFSLEQISINVIFALPRNIRAVALAFNIVDRVTNPWSIEIQMLAAIVGLSSPRIDQNLHGMGVFLGQQAVSGSSCTVDFSCNNILNELMQVTVAGYWWDPLAKRAPGGLRRGAGPFPL